MKELQKVLQDKAKDANEQRQAAYEDYLREITGTPGTGTGTTGTSQTR